MSDECAGRVLRLEQPEEDADLLRRRSDFGGKPNPGHGIIEDVVAEIVLFLKLQRRGILVLRQAVEIVAAGQFLCQLVDGGGYEGGRVGRPRSQWH